MFKNLFKSPDAEDLAKQELAEAKRELLRYQAQAEHAAKMVEFYTGMVARLSQYVETT